VLKWLKGGGMKEKVKQPTMAELALLELNQRAEDSK
jgi:hypothetical protein